MPTGIYKRTTWHLNHLPNRKGCKLSEEVKRNMQRGQRRRFADPVKRKQAYLDLHNPETEKSRSRKMKGHKFSKFRNKKISKSLKMYYSKPKNCRALWLAQNTPKARENRRKAHTGKHPSKETREKMRLSKLKNPTPLIDSKPELCVQDALNRLGDFYKKHKELPGMRKRFGVFHLVDILLPGRKVVIEVDGCFWHACNLCFSNSSERRKRNRKRDRKFDRLAKILGWRVIRIWEHTIKELDYSSGTLARRLRHCLPSGELQ